MKVREISGFLDPIQEHKYKERGSSVASDSVKVILELLGAYLEDAGYQMGGIEESAAGNRISIVVVKEGRKFRVTVSDAGIVR